MIQAQKESTYCTQGTKQSISIKWFSLKTKVFSWVTIQQYTRPPQKWCMYNLVIFFFIIIAIISVLVQLLHNDSHSRYFVTQEQLKCIKTNKPKKSVYCQK